MNNIKTGRFISVEGTEGVGKSTNIAVIHKLLEQASIEVVQTREPGGTDFAESLRALLLDSHEEAISQEAELLLMFAARAQHIQEVIQPALSRGACVLCDRFTDATFAYQGGGRGVNLEHIALLEELVQKGLKPDLTLLLDVDIEIGLERAKARSDLDRFEQEDYNFFQSVRSMYLKLAEQEPDRFRVVNAGLPLIEVEAQIKTIMATYLAAD